MPGPAQLDQPSPARSRGALLALVALVGALVAGLASVAGAAGVLSFDTIEALGLLLGYAPDRAWLLPVCLDVASVVAGVVWLAGIAPRAVPFARALCLATLGLSVVANGVGHGLEAYDVTRPALLLVVIGTAIPPAVLGAVVHLAVLVVRDLRGVPADEDEGDDEGSGEDATPRPCSDWSDEDLAADLARWAADPTRPAPSRDRVVAAYGVGAKRAAKLRDMARVGGETVTLRPVGSPGATGTEGSGR